MNPEASREPGYSFELVNIDCLPGSTNFNVIMHMDESIEDLLPYLAARIPSCTYVHGAGVINYMEAGHIVAIYPKHVTITDVASREDASSLCRNLYELATSVAMRKDSLEPVFNKRPSITVLDIFRFLPQTNCALCRCPTCMAFAAKVFRREAPIQECRPLMDDPERSEPLLARLRASGYVTG